MSTKMIELRPNRELLDVNFTGYKLSLEPVPSYKHNFEGDVDHVMPSDDQYSYLHLKVFSLHNHLCSDPWSPDVYFIDRRWKVRRSVSDVKSGVLKCMRDVWEIPASRPRQAGHYNPSMSFPAPEIALIADGTGVLHILKTPKRSSLQPEMWHGVFSDEVCGPNTPFVIADSRLVDVEGKPEELHCLLLRVDEAPEEQRERAQTRFQSTVVWMVFSPSESAAWTLAHSHKLACKGELDYLALEEGCKALYAASEHGIKFLLDSDLSSEADPLPAEVVSEKNGLEGGEEKKHYLWQQRSDDIEINFSVALSVEKREVTIESKEKTLHIACRGTTLLSGDLWGRIDPSLTCWTLQNGKLQVMLSKHESGQMWQQLVVGDSRGEEVVDPGLVAQVHERLAHLCSETEVTGVEESPAFNSQQLEECDTGHTSSVLTRLDPLSHSVTHQASLGGHQTLFSVRLAATATPALCLRHDVDGCVWTLNPPFSAQDDTSSWPISHTGTFHAFGYVQASKTLKKFSLCPPDLSYVAICDASRHVYIYRQPTAIASELKNRKTGQKVTHSAQQQLFALDDTAEVLGAHASNSWLFVLTSSYLLQLHVNQ